MCQGFSNFSDFMHHFASPQDFRKPSKPCNVGTHWMDFAAYSEMSRHVRVFQSFSRYFASFCITQINNQQHKGKEVISFIH